jgi:diguanylate cyclase (GGDEF)-like protein
MARFDTLTELPNRNQLIERLEEAFTSADTGIRSSAIVCFDLDGFKKVNDTLGHHIGDLLLRTVAARATALLPPGALVARLGADEFAAIVSGRSVADDSVAFATRVVAVISQPFHLEGHQVIISASAGVALADARDKGADDVLKRADVALNRAKSSGGNGFTVFEREMLQAVVARQRLEFELWQALDRGQFEVWYQPQIDLRTGRATGVEALLRWRHPERGIVSPGEFIPVAEAIGLIDGLGRWVMATACAEVASWPAAVRLAVNVSSVQFARSDMAQLVSQALAQSNLPPSQLDVEITESLFIQPSRKVHATLSRLRSLGVGIALDDFGTGYSSLSYIQKFPITKIKLDQSFVAGLPENASSASIVRAVAGLARDLQLKLNAEGVENPAQAAFLQSVGVNEVQGYLYGRPQPADEIVRFLKTSAEASRRRA